MNLTIFSVIQFFKREKFRMLSVLFFNSILNILHSKISILMHKQKVIPKNCLCISPYSTFMFTKIKCDFQNFGNACLRSRFLYTSYKRYRCWLELQHHEKEHIVNNKIKFEYLFIKTEFWNVPTVSFDLVMINIYIGANVSSISSKAFCMCSSLSCIFLKEGINEPSIGTDA